MSALKCLLEELETIRKAEEFSDFTQKLKTKKKEIEATMKMLEKLKLEYDRMSVNTIQQEKIKTKAIREISKCKITENDYPYKKQKQVKKVTGLGIQVKKAEKLPEWYHQVVLKISSCYFIRPYSMTIWNLVKQFVDKNLKKYKMEEYYFPCFINGNVMEAESRHIYGFEPEVCWVTKYGKEEIEKMAVRPTSEAIFFPSATKWVRTYQDLPLFINQWDTAMRWEFQDPQPFLRTREFMWQEAAGTYATKQEACDDQEMYLELYVRVYKDLLAVPVIKGRKTEKEEFAGALYTLTLETLIPESGRGIQAATSHYYGCNFSKVYNITFEDPVTKKEMYCHQNGYGLSTRCLGVMVLMHGDNKGLVLPPRVAPIQIIIIPCGKNVQIDNACSLLEKELANDGIRVKIDQRTRYTPGWKFYHWELKGVPIRVEVGPSEIKNNVTTVVRRETCEKLVVPRSQASQFLKQLLEEIQENLLQRATERINKQIVLTKVWLEFTRALNNKCIVLVPYCGDWTCEDNIKKDSKRDDEFAQENGVPSMGAKALCIPTEQPAPISVDDKCIYPECAIKPRFYGLFGRSY